MISLSQAVIVEGKYDKITLSQIIDAVIIVTNGFGIFKDKEKLELIRFYAENTGIIIMTDSDRAGFVIRNHIKGVVKNGRIQNVYIPDIMGKEKRKIKPSAEGKLGVEGMNREIILKALEKAGVTASEKEIDKSKLITKTDLFMLGLSGKPDSSNLRRRLLKYLNMPSLLSANSMLEVLNTIMDIDKLTDIVQKELKGE